LFARLAEPSLYLGAVERVRERQLRGGEFRPLASDGPWLQAMNDIESFARALAREVSSGSYAFGPMSARTARIGSEARTLYSASPLDEIVLSALASACSEVLEDFLSPCVYSYRRGRSALRAVGAWLNYLRAHRGRSSERRNWGLYVLRRDVRGYGDAIESGPDSRLWPLLREAFTRVGREPTDGQLRWLQQAFRPRVSDANGATTLPDRGIPTGSSLQPSACNVYLTPIDRLLESIPGGFYARYGDDMLFAHPDPEQAMAALRDVDREADALALAWSPNKCAELYLNLAGRSPAPQFAAWKGAASLAYLGMRVDFSGVIGLPREKLRRLLRDLQLRLSNSDRLLRGAHDADRGRDLCAIANAVLDPDHASANPSALALRYLASDRSQLRDLDYKIALLVAQQLSGRRGVRAFRSYSPRALRTDLGLVSLVGARNRIGRSRERQLVADG
jgi:hypothetical protein